MLTSTGYRVLHALLLAIFLLAGPVAYAQAPTWQTLLTSTTSNYGNYTSTEGTAPAPDGNMYVTGIFTQTISLGNITLTSAGGSDIFIAKWDKATNSFSWAQRIGGTGNDKAEAIAANGTNIYVTGTFSGASVPFGNTVLSSSTAGGNIFITKLIDTGSAGSFVWAKNAGGPEDHSAYAIAVEGQNVYIAGYFAGATASFGPLTLTRSPGSYDSYVAKLQDAGSDASFVWAQQTVGDEAQIYALAVNGSAVYVAGSFKGANMRFGTTSLTSVGADDMFVAKIQDAGASGSFVWAQRAGGARGDRARALSVVGNTVYVGGDFTGATAEFGGQVLTTALFESEIFIVKFTDANATAKFEWVMQAGGGLHDFVQTLAARDTDLYLTGYFTSRTANFGATQLTNSGSTSVGDIYVAKITNTAGVPRFAWARSAGGNAGEDGSNLVLSGSTVCVAGTVSPPATFGTLPVTIADGNAVRAYVATMTDPLLLTAKTAAPPVDVQLYPNPAHGRVLLEVAPYPGAKQAALTLLDALGRNVRTYSVALPASGLRHALDLTGLRPGLYAVRVQADAGQSMHWLTVE